jgi:peptidoglycan-associated lipoprotein
MKNGHVSLLLFFTLIITGCASKKPTMNNPDVDKDGAINSNGLVLHGSSDSGTAGNLKTVYFSLNSTTLDSDAKKILTDNAAFLKDATTVSIQIEGHCDERGSRQFNLALGERRAKTIRDYLNALGIKADRMKTLSWGNEKPVAEGSFEDAWSKNRRANFVVIEK